MGDSSTCLLQPFSYVSGGPNDLTEGNPTLSLQQSISFGRFVSDSVSWEKWSVFSNNNNRYVEEAERYSRPGSVAQKKAFFEAHYKKMAARKAAALLEQQANSLSSEAHESEDNIGSRTEVEASLVQEVTEDERNQTCSALNYSRTCSDFKEMNQNVVDVEDKGVILSYDKESWDEELLEATIQFNESGDSGVGIAERKIDTEDKKIIVEISETDPDEQKEVEESGITEIEKPLLMQKSADQEKAAVSAVSKKKTAMFSSKLFACGKGSKQQPMQSPAKPATPIHFKKEIYVTPNSKKKLPTNLANQKRTTPNLSGSSYFTPAKNVDEVNSTAVPRSSKNAKNCPTSSVTTPSMEMRNGTSRSSLVTPQSMNRRTPLDRSAVESRSADPKKRSLATDWSNFLSSCRSKLQSPSLSSPFRLKTEERASRRKEKLEEKFNADQAKNQKLQPQPKFKEKGEIDMIKFRQSLCFKARPLPDFYKEKGAPKNNNCPKKVPFPSSLSSQPGRKPKVAAVQNVDPLPQRPPIRMNQSKRIQGKGGQTPPIQTRTSRPLKSVFENVSPNIPQW